ncbi:MAG: hypothetical protein M3116_00980 [Actinomycetota bacterium]|nr:hypothetical protein [Actinomycetota bacterium]
MKRSAATVVLLIGLGIGTVGCASASTPSTAPTTTAAEEPSPTPTATPTPTEQAEPEAERIIVGADAIVVLGSDGSELAAYDYFQDTAELVAGFTEVFGRPAAESPFEGDAHSPAGVQRAWDGFAILDDDRDPVPPHTPNHLVDVTANEVGGIAVETADGFTVGTSAEEVEAAPGAQPYPASGIIQVDSVPLDFDDPICPEGGCTFSVRLFTDEPGELIVRMLAPAPNFGP